MFNIVTIRFMQNASTQKYGEWKIGEKYFHIIIARFRLHLTREIECFVSNWIFCVGYVWATSIVWEQLLDQITYDKHMTHYFQQKIRKIPSFFSIQHYCCWFNSNWIGFCFTFLKPPTSQSFNINFAGFPFTNSLQFIVQQQLRLRFQFQILFCSFLILVLLLLLSVYFEVISAQIPKTNCRFTFNCSLESNRFSPSNGQLKRASFFLSLSILCK